jgi:hypothetical protein
VSLDVIRKQKLRIVNFLFITVILLISSVFSYNAYIKGGGNIASILWGIYAFGAFLIPAIIIVHPGEKTETDNNGWKVKVPRGKNLSKAQASIIFSWIVGFGLLMVYVTQIENIL